MQTYVNPISKGQDPFVLRSNDGMYYSVFTGGSNNQCLYVSQSERLTEPGIPHMVFRSPEQGWNAGSFWAPEIHFLLGKYYIYYTSAVIDGSISAWSTRRLGVLESEHPLGPYIDMGKLELGEEMSIDGTVMESGGKLFFVYMRNARFGDSMNCLYIAQMSSPTEISGSPHFLCQPEYPWEEYVNEGPEAIRHNGKQMIVYSAHAAHTEDYCLALLTCENEQDILTSTSWKKFDKPIFTKGNGILGPGHASMTVAPDGQTPCLVYHCKSNDYQHFEQIGSMWRMVCVQPFSWHQDGTPNFGQPLMLGEPLPLLPGEKPDQQGCQIENAIRSENQHLIFYGGRQYLTIVDDILYLDANELHEYGCKAIIRGLQWQDALLSVDMRMPDGNGAGLILRCRNEGARKNLMEGYIARLCPRFGLQVLCVDKQGVKMLGHKSISMRTGDWVHLEARMCGNKIIVSAADTVLEVTDEEFDSGRVGLWAENCLAWFKNMKVEAL